MEDVPKSPLITPLFTGKDVSVQALIPEGGNYNMSIVNFGKGIRNKFHVHGSDQILIVTAGKGIVATEQEQKRNHRRDNGTHLPAVPHKQRFFEENGSGKATTFISRFRKSIF
jgi:quercetin dioxygenase-like cupin family protein